MAFFKREKKLRLITELITKENKLFRIQEFLNFQTQVRIRLNGLNKSLRGALHHVQSFNAIHDLPPKHLENYRNILFRISLELSDLNHLLRERQSEVSTHLGDLNKIESEIAELREALGEFKDIRMDFEDEIKDMLESIKIALKMCTSVHYKEDRKVA